MKQLLSLVIVLLVASCNTTREEFLVDWFLTPPPESQCQVHIGMTEDKFKTCACETGLFGRAYRLEGTETNNFGIVTSYECRLTPKKYARIVFVDGRVRHILYD